jgi:DNA-binding response OmpR family regulator
MTRPGLNKATVLVVDDSEELLDIFKLIIEKAGGVIITKTSANDLVSFVQRYRVDMLILDVLLKGNNGRTVCKQLKSNQQTNYFPIVLMSASPEYLVDFKECNADDCIEKPFDIYAVLNKINYLLSQHEPV